MTRASQLKQKQKKKKIKIAAISITIIILIALATTAIVIAQTVYNIPIFPVTQTQTAEKTDEEYAKALQTLSAAMDENLKKITSEAAGVPDSLQQLYTRNQETLDFVLDYKNRAQYEKNSSLTQEEIKNDTPHFLQWDKRWGYTTYCDGFFAVTACGPTCLSMVIVGLTHNENATPRIIADYSERNGYSIPGTGTAWKLMTSGAKAYGLHAKELYLDKNIMIQELDLGHPIICALGPGDFTQVGHFIVIYGYKDGQFQIHDPNSILRSEKTWDFDLIKGQILNLWSFSKK